MKCKILRSVLETGLSNCYDASERKTSESITKFNFNDNKLNISCKGFFTFYEQDINLLSSDADCFFFLKTNTIYEFVKHISCEELIIAYDENKKACVIASLDKKSKIAIQTVEIESIFEESNDYDIKFNIDNPNDFISKLNYASKFCSSNFQDYPLTGIHCEVNGENFEIKATNGPAFYGTSFEKSQTENIEFYMPKKSPVILKNIFSGQVLKSLSLNNKNALFESETSKLVIYLEKSDKNSFPNQIIEWSKKDSDANIKVSNFELTKTLKFFNGIFSDDRTKFTIDNTLILESNSQGNDLAAKENILIEHCEGQAQSTYSTRFLLDSLESLQSSWLNLFFIKKEEGYYICKITNNETLVLLCPAM
jgi:DNA polymerase III sliding clamp (beta) subunit (PCNA family)